MSIYVLFIQHNALVQSGLDNAGKSTSADCKIIDQSQFNNVHIKIVKIVLKALWNGLPIL